MFMFLALTRAARTASMLTKTPKDLGACEVSRTEYSMFLS